MRFVFNCNYIKFYLFIGLNKNIFIFAVAIRVLLLSTVGWDLPVFLRWAVLNESIKVLYSIDGKPLQSTV